MNKVKMIQRIANRAGISFDKAVIALRNMSNMESFRLN